MLREKCDFEVFLLHFLDKVFIIQFSQSYVLQVSSKASINSIPKRILVFL